MLNIQPYSLKVRNNLYSEKFKKTPNVQIDKNPSIPLYTTNISFSGLRPQSISQRLSAIIEKHSSVFVDVNLNFLRKINSKVVEWKKRPCLIGISGESGSGKSTLTKNIASEINMFQRDSSRPTISVINSDNFLKDNSAQVKRYGGFDNFILKSGYSFNTHDAYNLDELAKTLDKLKKGDSIYIPEYKMDGSCRSIPNRLAVSTSNIILTEGLYMLCPKLKGTFDVNIFVDIAEDVQKKRWFDREASRGTKHLETMEKFYKDITNKAKEYIYPYRNNADIIINGASKEDEIKAIIREITNALKT